MDQDFPAVITPYSETVRVVRHTLADGSFTFDVCQKTITGNDDWDWTITETFNTRDEADALATQLVNAPLSQQKKSPPKKSKEK